MAGLIDPTKTGKFPVILGDSLRGKTVNEVFTAIQYNHKPALSSASAPNSARLRPSTPGKTSSYDLTYTDNNQKFAFSGPRQADEKKYVLYFSQAKQAFVLDKVDSTFNMNVTRLPGNNDAESLRRQHPHIDNTPKPAPKAAKPAPAKSGPLKPPPKPRAKPVLPAKKKDLPAQRKKPEPKPAAKPMNLALPVGLSPQEMEKKNKEMEKAKQKEASKHKPKEKPQGDEFDYGDDEDDDGGLLVEYPDGDPAKVASKTEFSPAFTSVRFDDYMNNRESEGDDDDDDDTKMEDVFGGDVQTNNNNNNNHVPFQHDNAEANENEVTVNDDDLEQELRMAFALDNAGDESEISEED